MIVEVSRFRLVPGTDEDAFLAAADETQSEFLGRQGGFVSRELLRTDDGWWMDVVRFDTAEAAQAAFEAFAQDANVRKFESMLDATAVTMSHWSVARSW